MKKSKTSCDLKSCFFCKLCLPEWRTVIDVQRQTYHVGKNELLFNEGDKAAGIYFVVEGSVKVHKKWGEKELIVRFAKKGDIVGHRALGDDISFPVSATAMEPSVVCFIPIEFFMSSLKVNHELLLELMLFFAEELKVSERKMRNLAHMPVKGRVALALLTMQEKFGTDVDSFINLVFTKQDLASYSGATYESVFKVLNDLSDEGLIKTSGKKIGVVDKKKLALVSRLPD